MNRNIQLLTFNFQLIINPQFLNKTSHFDTSRHFSVVTGHSVTYFCNENQVAECSNDEGVGMYRSPGHFDTILFVPPDARRGHSATYS